jgi:hypothetical protein
MQGYMNHEVCSFRPSAVHRRVSPLAFAISLHPTTPHYLLIIQYTSQSLQTRTSTSHSKTGLLFHVHATARTRRLTARIGRLKAIQTQSPRETSALSISRRSMRCNRSQPESMERDQYLRFEEGLGSRSSGDGVEVGLCIMFVCRILVFYMGHRKFDYLSDFDFTGPWEYEFLYPPAPRVV